MSASRKRRHQKKPFIVKLQTPVVGSEILIYNQDKSLLYTQPVSDDVMGLMNGRKKAFFWARMLGTVIHIDREAPWQTW